MELPDPANFRIAVGVDIVAVERVERLVTRRPAARERLFTARELDHCLGKRRRYEHLAARFAAKEAVLKALGSGWAGGVRWTDVEVVSGNGGRPRVRLDGEAAARAEREGVVELEVSLSHTPELALAYALAVLR